MKMFVLTQADFDSLLANLDRNPEYGWRGGSSAVLTDLEKKANDEAHQFFNYQIRTWIHRVQE